MRRSSFQRFLRHISSAWVDNRVRQKLRSIIDERNKKIGEDGLEQQSMDDRRSIDSVPQKYFDSRNLAYSLLANHCLQKTIYQTGGYDSTYGRIRDGRVRIGFFTNLA